MELRTPHYHHGEFSSMVLAAAAAGSLQLHTASHIYAAPFLKLGLFVVSSSLHEPPQNIIESDSNDFSGEAHMFSFWFEFLYSFFTLVVGYVK